MKYEAVHACELEGDYHAHEWGVIDDDTGVVCECESEEDAINIALALNRFEAPSLGCYHCGSCQCNGEQCTLKEFCVGDKVDIIGPNTHTANFGVGRQGEVVCVEQLVTVKRIMDSGHEIVINYPGSSLEKVKNENS